MKQTLKIGITVFVIAAMAMSGIALAQTDETNEQALAGRIAEQLQALVDDGTLTADQAEAVADFLAENAPRGGRHGRHGVRHALARIAEFLGMDGAEFRSALEEYDTLGDIAAANGSSAAELIEFMVGQAEERITKAVADGRLTQAEADEKLAEIEDKITDKVNSELPEQCAHRPGRRGPAGGDVEFGGRPAVEATD